MLNEIMTVAAGGLIADILKMLADSIWKSRS